MELQARGVGSFATLAQSTPSVSLKSEQTEIELRGMTSSGGNSATVGFYLDDIPMTAPAGAQNGKVVIDPTLYDLNRVEVLRGPQGTLYGSGSMGGTVRLITNQPDPTAFHASAQSVLSATLCGRVGKDQEHLHPHLGLLRPEHLRRVPAVCRRHRPVRPDLAVLRQGRAVEGRVHRTAGCLPA
jgi:hypothetical protein